MADKIIIYQVFTRLFGNKSHGKIHNGTLAENGCGKMNFFDEKILRRIKNLGVTHVWYTGVIRHATTTDYSSYCIPRQHPAVVKGKAGSPYAICDYYDIDPDLADDVERRVEEFDALVSRTHDAAMKVVIDFVPNHVARVIWASPTTKASSSALQTTSIIVQVRLSPHLSVLLTARETCILRIPPRLRAMTILTHILARMTGTRR